MEKRDNKLVETGHIVDREKERRKERYTKVVHEITYLKDSLVISVPKYGQMMNS